MIPYFEIPPIRVGVIEVQVFGVVWFLAWIVSAGVAISRADVEGRRLGVTAGFFALAGPLVLIEGPFYELALSGSELVGVVVTLLPLAVLWFAILEPSRLWANLDGASLAAVVGWMVGRFGSFLAHDDLGMPTVFPFAVRGICPQYLHNPVVACHDLALYDIGACVLWLWTLAVLRGRGAGAGIATAATCAAFGVWSFVTDLVRPGWVLSTPDRWLEPMLIGLGVVVVLAAGVAREPRPGQGPTP